MSQNYQRWFTDWPSTHVNTGTTVEVTPVAALERAERAEAAARAFAEHLAAIGRVCEGSWRHQQIGDMAARALADHPSFAPSEAARKAEREAGER